MYVALIILLISLAIIFKVRTKNQILEMFAAVVSIILTIALVWDVFIRILNVVADKYSMVLGVFILGVVLLLAVVGFLVVVILLFRNTVIMQTREGRSFTGKLSALLAINFLFLIALMIFYTQVAMPVILKSMFATLFWFDTFLTLMFFGYLAYSVAIQVRHYNGPIDYIIVLGAWSGKGTIPPLLKSRVDAGLNYYREIEKKSGNTPKFVVSGGKGVDELNSEAKVMADYLYSVGVKNDDIILEDQATNTIENFKYSKSLIEEDWEKEERPAVVFSTSNYHVMRASGYAKKAGINALGIGAPTSLFFLPSALIREFVAIVVQSKYFFFAIFILMYILLYFSFKMM